MTGKSRLIRASPDFQEGKASPRDGFQPRAENSLRKRFNVGKGAFIRQDRLGHFLPLSPLNDCPLFVPDCRSKVYLGENGGHFYFLAVSPILFVRETRTDEGVAIWENVASAIYLFCRFEEMGKLEIGP